MTDDVSNALDEGMKHCSICGYWFMSKAQRDKHIKHDHKYSSKVLAVKEDHKDIEAKTYVAVRAKTTAAMRVTDEAIKRIRTYSGVELKGKELGQQLGVRWLR